MKILLIPLMLLVFSGSVFASLGFSFGIKPLEIPVDINGSELDENEVVLLRLGTSLTPDIRVEMLGGYDKITEHEDGIGHTFDLWALGVSGFYVIANPANTVCSAGISLMYSKCSGEDDNIAKPLVKSILIYPVMRFDYAIPGMEQIAFFTELGIRYTSATKDYEAVETDYTAFELWGSEHILGGVYYNF